MKKILIRLALTCSSLLALSPESGAQAKYWGFNYNNTLGFMPAPTITAPGPTATPLFRQNINAHTIYDNSGQILFTVSTEGIFDRTGIMVRDMKGSIPGYSGSYVVNSEIEVFPNGKACGHYYVTYWTIAGGTIRDHMKLLDVDASNPTSITVIDEPDPVMYAGPATNLFPLREGAGFGMVATSTDRSGSRRLYTLYQQVKPSFIGGPDTLGDFVIECWRFDADGNYSLQTSTPLNWGGIGDKMGMASIMEATPDGEQIAWAGPKSLKVFRPATGLVTTYPVPALAADDGNITGIEWVPQMRRWYVSYQYMSGGTPTSTIGYFKEGITTVMNSAGAPSPQFGSSELELGLDGNLYFASAPGTLLGDPGGDPTTNPGVLFKLNPYVSPHTYSVVSSIQVKMSSANGAFFYINNQIDGEDHQGWNTVVSRADHFDINNGTSEAPAFVSPSGCSIPLPTSSIQYINACANGLLLNFKNSLNAVTPLNFNEQYSVSWFETNECGQVLLSGIEYYDSWHYGNGPIDLKTYGSATLGSPAASGKYFILVVKIRNTCNSTEVSWTKNIMLIPQPVPVIAGWSISNDDYWATPGDNCAAAPCSDMTPSLRLNTGSTDFAEYWIELTDFGNAACSPAPAPVKSYPAVAYAPGSCPLTTTPIAPVPLIAYLSATGTPMMEAMGLFSAPGRLFGVRILGYSSCGIGATTPMKYFRSCNYSSAKLAASDLAASCDIAPNPATNYIGLSFSAVNGKKCSAALYAMDGKLIQTLLPEQTATTNEISLKVPLGEVAPGIYFCKYSIDGVPGTTRVQVSR